MTAPAALEQGAQWAAFRQALTTVPTGATLTVDTIRDHLTAAQIPPAALGGLFRQACYGRWIVATGRVVACREVGSRGRLIRVYRRTDRHLGDAP